MLTAALMTLFLTPHPSQDADVRVRPERGIYRFVLAREGTYRFNTQTGSAEFCPDQRACFDVAPALPQNAVGAMRERFSFEVEGGEFNAVVRMDSQRGTVERCRAVTSGGRNCIELVQRPVRSRR